MPDETPSTSPAAAPLAAPAPRPPAVQRPPYSAWAHKFDTNLREEVRAEIEALSPVQADPAYLAIAKAAAIGMVDALPEDFRGCSVQLELPSQGRGKQLTCIVIPAMPKKA